MSYSYEDSSLHMLRYVFVKGSGGGAAGNGHQAKMWSVSIPHTKRRQSAPAALERLAAEHVCYKHLHTVMACVKRMLANDME
jgi:hypothetical protein